VSAMPSWSRPTETFDLAAGLRAHAGHRVVGPCHGAGDESGDAARWGDFVAFRNFDQSQHGLRSLDASGIRSTFWCHSDIELCVTSRGLTMELVAGVARHARYWLSPVVARRRSIDASLPTPGYRFLKADQFPTV
jgi:hypothetical protein